MLKRAALVISIFFSMLSMAFASIYSEASSYDPMSAASYYGSFYDVFSNPAALPCLETETGNLSLSLMLSDDWDAGAMAGERMPLLQQQDWDIRASFIARNIALSAFFGTEFARTGADPVYDIYSTLKIQVDVAYAFPHISFGARVTGGNRMIRSERTVDSFTDIFANAWFSPFKRDAGSEFFDLGVGAILEFSPFSAGVYVGKLLTLRNSNIYLGWDTLAESTTISMALEGGRFTKAGDLMLVRPRVSFSLTGLIDASTRKIEAEGDITFQFLPDADFTIAISYLELHHDWFHFNAANGYVSIVLRGGADGFYGTLGVVFRATDFTSFSPTISFSYIS